MLYDRSAMRYAHTTGHTGLIYTHDGEYIITCGSDGDIRKWRGIDDDDPSSNCLGEFVICLAQKENKILASTDRNTVQAYTFPEMDNDGTLLRFTAPVICMAVSGEYLVAGSEDTNIKIIKDGESQPFDLEGHKGPILGIDINPKGTHVASVGGDGVLKIWSLHSGFTEIKEIAGLPKANSFENAMCFGTPTFEPVTGKYLAYVNGKEICIVNTSTWDIQFNLTDDNVKGDYTCCQFSKDGAVIAAGTTKGEFSLFDFAKRKCLKCEGPSNECQAITCLAWSAKNNEELAYCDSTGQLGTLFLSDALSEPREHLVSDDNRVTNIFQDIEFADDEAQAENDLNGIDDDDNDAISTEKLKKKIMSFANSEVPDDDTKDSLDQQSVISSNEVYVSGLRNAFKQQKAFQPSSTPLNLEHRYLVWNSVGIATLHSEGTDGAIDVEFHDASVHHSLHIPNYNNHNMASLSSTVLAMASDNSSKLVCIALSASGNKEWSIELPDCESVVAICATSSLVAISTSMQYLRIFTVMGTQREVVSIPGPVICLAGYEDRILVTYHRAPSNEKQQHIEGLLAQTCGLKLKCQYIQVPITPERMLTWLGFSDCGSPVFSDSLGLVQLFSLNSNCWYPVCDTMKQSSSISNNYFVISLSERSQILQAVLCRGTSYPMTTPRPMVQELPLQLPFCDIESEKSMLEDSLLRASIMSADNAEKVLKEAAIKLFALACRSEMEMRGKEIIEIIACPDLLMLAVKYANKLGRLHLADRLSEILSYIDEQNSREQQDPLVDQSLPNSPLILLKAFHNGTSTLTKLAPKSIELCSAKKSSLKRLSLSNSTSSSLFKRTSNDTQPLVATSVITQENLSSNDFQFPNTSADDCKTLTRSPLNAVNPFASKRKISELDKTILMGSEKLKMAKK